MRINGRIPIHFSTRSCLKQEHSRKWEAKLRLPAPPPPKRAHRDTRVRCRRRDPARDQTAIPPFRPARRSDCRSVCRPLDRPCAWAHQLDGDQMPNAGATASPAFWASTRPGRCPLATTSTSTAVAVVESVFTEPGRLARAGFLAGYTGLTREAYALDCASTPAGASSIRCAVPGAPRRHRVLRPRPRGPRPRPGHYHPAGVHPGSHARRREGANASIHPPCVSVGHQVAP
jgi:hypothetical protein